MIEYIFITIAVAVIAALLVQGIVNRCAYRKRAKRIHEHVERIMARQRVGGAP